MKPNTALAAATALVALLLLPTAVAQGAEWKVWMNPRQDVTKSQTLSRLAIELIGEKYGKYIPHTNADDDGGYTFHVYFRETPKVMWGGSLVDYREDLAAYAQYVVRLWNASLKFAAENYEWGEHLSKLRLKFYTSENASKAPRIDVVIVPLPCIYDGFAYACAVFKYKKPTEIQGNLDALPHELGHALGLGHNPHEFSYYYDDWRGFRADAGYPTPGDTFVLYGLAVMWSSLKNARAGSQLTFPNAIIRYSDVAGIVGLPHSWPGKVWAYLYSVLVDEDGVHPYPSPFVHDVPETLYGDDLCVGFHLDGGVSLPFVKTFENGTALVLHEIDLQSAIIDRKLEYSPIRRTRHDLYRVQLKLLNYVNLDDLVKHHGNRTIIEVHVYDSLGPAWDNVSGISYRGDKICLHGLKERVLVEARLRKAHKVDAVGLAEAVLVSGQSYTDANGTTWVLKGSTVYFRPLNNTYSPSYGVRYVWRGVNLTLTVEGPITGSELMNRLWKKQYLVEVDSPHPFEGVGWFDEGLKTSPKPAGGYVDLGNGTRLIFKGFEGHEGGEVTVDRPLKLRPVWERMYMVETVSRYVFSEAGKYFREGERIFTMMPRIQELGNGTKVELLNITAYGPNGELVRAWDGKPGGEAYGLLQLTVDRPLRIVVSWRVYHRLTVTSPVNSYEDWVLNGTVHRLDLPEKKLLAQDTLMVLRQVLVNGNPHAGGEVVVTGPTSVEGVYSRKLLTTLMLDAGNGYLMEPGEVVLEREGEVEVYRPPFTYVGEGTWRVTKATYLGGDVTVEAVIEVNIAGMRTIPSKLRAVEITVVDLVGIPVPYASVKAENTGGTTGFSGVVTIPAVPPWDFEAITYHVLGSGKATIRPGETSARISAGVSPYTLALLATAATAGVVVWRRKASRR